jgi:hypothetical protein
MNEIVGTLYFVLAHDSNKDWANEAEADTYFLFNSIMVSNFYPGRAEMYHSVYHLMCSLGGNA